MYLNLLSPSVDIKVASSVCHNKDTCNKHQHTYILTHCCFYFCMINFQKKMKLQSQRVYVIVMDWMFVSSQNPSVEALTLVFTRWDPWEVTGLRWGPGDGVSMMGWVLLEEERPELSCSLSLLCEDTGRRLLSASQQAGLHWRPKSAHTLILDLPASRTVREKFLLFTPFLLF